MCKQMSYRLAAFFPFTCRIALTDPDSAFLFRIRRSGMRLGNWIFPSSIFLMIEVRNSVSCCSTCVVVARLQSLLESSSTSAFWLLNVSCFQSRSFFHTNFWSIFGSPEICGQAWGGEEELHHEIDQQIAGKVNSATAKDWWVSVLAWHTANAKKPENEAE